MHSISTDFLDERKRRAGDLSSQRYHSVETIACWRTLNLNENWLLSTTPREHPLGQHDATLSVGGGLVTSGEWLRRVYMPLMRMRVCVRVCVRMCVRACTDKQDDSTKLITVISAEKAAIPEISSWTYRAQTASL